MKYILCLLMIGLTLTAFADEKLKGIACRSVHLSYPGMTGTAFCNDVIIERSAPGTYFMVCGWDKGYFGMQEQGNGKKLLIFSVWDSNQNDKNGVPEDKRTKLLYKDDKVRIGRFGGEGTGGQSFFDYDWKLNTAYRFMVASQPNGERTEYTGYFFVPEDKQWKKLITFSTITGNAGKPMRGFYSFVEDFKRDKVSATKVRKARFGHGWVCQADGTWRQIDQARFTGDSNPVENISAGVDQEYFFLATGGESKMKEYKLKDVIPLKVSKESMPGKDILEVLR